jgi:succinate-acetate transporter protein
VKPLGIFGELIFTIFGLFWLLWPLYVTYILINDMEFPQELWLGGIILTVLLIVRGRKIILKGGKISN